MKEPPRKSDACVSNLKHCLLQTDDECGCPSLMVLKTFSFFLFFDLVWCNIKGFYVMCVGQKFSSLLSLHLSLSWDSELPGEFRRCWLWDFSVFQQQLVWNPRAAPYLSHSAAQRRALRLTGGEQADGLTSFPSVAITPLRPNRQC